MGKKTKVTKVKVGSDTPSNIVTELTGLKDLVKSQQRAGIPRDEVMKSLLSSWTARPSSLVTASAQERVSITNALTSGPWDPDQVTSLARLLVEQGTQKRIRLDNQKCTTFENFIPQNVWAHLRSPHKYSEASRMAMLANAARAINIINPDQPTLYRMAAILAYTDQSVETNQDWVYTRMDRIQNMIKSGAPAADPEQYIVQHPHSAQGLPKELLASTFTTNDSTPVEVTIPELDIVLGGTKMRGRTRESKHYEWIQFVPSEHKAAVLQGISEYRAGPTPPTWIKHVPEEYRSVVLASLANPSPSTQVMQHNAPTPCASLMRARTQQYASSNQPPPLTTPDDDTEEVDEKGTVEELEAVAKGSVEEMENALLKTDDAAKKPAKKEKGEKASAAKVKKISAEAKKKKVDEKKEKPKTVGTKKVKAKTDKAPKGKKKMRSQTIDRPIKSQERMQLI